jgi:hypothetical protein
VQVVDQPAIAEMINRFRRAKEAAGESFGGVLVDQEHFSYDTSKSSEAMAWIMDLQNRGGTLYAQLRLTDLGEQALQNGRYKFISPVWKPRDCQALGNKRIRPLRLDSCGLTNAPNIKGLPPLVNRDLQEDFDGMMNRVKEEHVSRRGAEALKNSNPNHDEGGRFAEAPARISAEEADRQLEQGFTEKDAKGRDVKFGKRMKDKLDKASDGRQRKEHLPWAREAVKSGTSTDVMEKGEKRTVYAKVFRHESDNKGILTVASVSDGEVFDTYRYPAKKLIKRYGNREDMHQAGERPPECVLQDLAAAGIQPDCLQSTQDDGFVNRRDISAAVAAGGQEAGPDQTAARRLHMKKEMAPILGLDAAAEDSVYVAAVQTLANKAKETDALKNRAENAEAGLLALTVERDLEEHKGKYADREQAKAALLKNREATLAAWALVPAPVKGAILNRKDGKTPEGDKQPDFAARVAAQQAAVSELCNRNPGMSRTHAFTTLQAQGHEAFKS